MAIFKRLCRHRLISPHPVRNKSFVNPVISLRRPYREPAQPLRLRIPQPPLEPHPRLFGRIRQLIHSEPRQVAPAQPLELLHRPEQYPRFCFLHRQIVVPAIHLVRNLVFFQNLDQRCLRGVPEHGERRSSDQSSPSRVDIAQLDRFMTKRRALARPDRPRKPFEPGLGRMKSSLRFERRIRYFSESSTHVTLISLGVVSAFSSFSSATSLM